MRAYDEWLSYPTELPCRIQSLQTHTGDRLYHLCDTITSLLGQAEQGGHFPLEFQYQEGIQFKTPGLHQGAVGTQESLEIMLLHPG